MWRRIVGKLAARVPNLVGDRDVEWSWIAGHIPEGPGEAMDFGNGGSFLGLAAAQRGFNVTAVDLGPVFWPYQHPRLRFLQGDLLTLPFAPAQFDLILSCSTVEHVGLAGRYGVQDGHPDGDLDAMKRLKSLLKPTGRMLMTIPVGRDALFSPLCRVYGPERLPKLLDDYRVEQEAYWAKSNENRWDVVERNAALDYVADVRSVTPRRNIYALGLFVLRPR